MNKPHPSLRIITVTSLSLFFCLSYVPDLVRVAGHPLGDFGFRTNGRTVTIVERDSPAERAGMRPGDRIDLSGLSQKVRWRTRGGYAVYPGDTATFKIWRAGRFRPIALRATEGTKSIPTFIVIRELAFLVPLAIGISLVLLRPSPVTWGFFLFSLTAGGVPPNTVLVQRILPGSWAVVWIYLLRGVLPILPKVGLVLFAFSLPRRPLGTWPLIAITVTLLLAIVESIPHFFTADATGWPQLTAWGDVIAALIALIGLLYAYSHVTIRLRQRLHWIAAGFVLWVVVDVIDALGWPAYESYGVHTAIDASLVIFPLMVAYAIFRERVVDITFVLSRTVAYGFLTAIIVGVFALVDLFLSRSMESRLSLPVDIIVALVLGFFFHSMHNRIDAGVDRVIFRKRYIAEAGLARAAKAVVQVEETQAVADYVTRLPVEVLDLTGAALYTRQRGGFVLERCVGWKHEPSATLTTSDPLVAFISSELACVRVGDVPMRAAAPDRHDTAVLAIPLLYRRELGGFVLYGAHADGADLDADEERALVPLVNNAAVTYDHIEAQALREEIRALRALKAVTS